MSGERRLTSNERRQRSSASLRSNHKRRLLRLQNKLDNLKEDVKELSELNYPPLRLPHSSSKSIIIIEPKSGGLPTVDHAIEKFLDMLEINLRSVISEAGRLKKR